MRILLVDDHRLMREGLRFILERDNLDVVGEAADGREALEKVRDLKPDVAIMDVSMPQMNGVEATKRIISHYPETAVIALSAHQEKQYILEMLDAGVSGYVIKDAAANEILQALKSVGSGKKYLSPDVTDTVMMGYINRDQQKQSDVKISLGAREREVLQLLAEGFTSNQIGSKMDISTSTVETHRRNIMKKLNLHSVAELTKFAVREGLTSL